MAYLNEEGCDGGQVSICRQLPTIINEALLCRLLTGNFHILQRPNGAIALLYNDAIL